MLCDLNIPWPVTNYKAKPLAQQIAQVKNILLTLSELNYTHAALNFLLDPSNAQPSTNANPTSNKKNKNKQQTLQQISKKDFVNPIDLSLFAQEPFAKKIKLYTRLTIVLNDPADFPGMKIFNDLFDIIAIQPINDKALLMCITNLEVDLITFNYADNLRFWLRNKAVHSGIAKGKRFEIVYNTLFPTSAPSAALSTNDPAFLGRKNFLSVTKNLVRASRSSGLVISSGATAPMHVKTKFDLEILLKLVNVSRHKIPQTINENPVKVLLTGKLRLNSYKQTVSIGSDVLESDILQCTGEAENASEKNGANRHKRKINEDELSILAKLQKR